MSQAIKDIEADLIDEFSFFDDWMDKYQHIIEMGQDLPGIDQASKTDDNIVHGCQSRVWLVAKVEGDRVIYRADSDAIITKGLIAMLIRVLSGQTADTIIQADLAFMEKIGIREHLSPTRSNGLSAMIKQMKFYAIAAKGR
ncbi:MAG: SufE family protein [Bacteroidia bacterium]|nr:SufE family protein [Bacteroidia bacterium]